MTYGRKLKVGTEFLLPAGVVRYLGTILASTTPNLYESGVSYGDAATADGWPHAGIVITVKRTNVSVAATQFLIPTTTSDTLNRGHIISRVGTGSVWQDWRSPVLPGRSWTAITLVNGWVHHTSGFSPQYMKDDAGMVHLRGLVKSGTSPNIGTIGSTSSRPLTAQRVPLAVASNPSAQLDVRSDGGLWLVGTYSNAYVSLDGIRFLPE